ncbi:hypothetical protein V6N13_016818 [Hibiscus sabdariffa]|uniref:Uncharacterized protein n=1 Tax=Hibiscus sabdariffa TaxID=183260 RepID=A0ABR2PUF5_9ROSI
MAAIRRNQDVYPLVVAAHLMEPNQFAIGLSDRSMKLMEPSESEGKWGVRIKQSHLGFDDGINPNGRKQILIGFDDGILVLKWAFLV